MQLRSINTLIFVLSCHWWGRHWCKFHAHIVFKSFQFLMAVVLFWKFWEASCFYIDVIQSLFINQPLREDRKENLTESYRYVVDCWKRSGEVWLTFGSLLWLEIFRFGSLVTRWSEFNSITNLIADSLNFILIIICFILDSCLGCNRCWRRKCKYDSLGTLVVLKCGQM